MKNAEKIISLIYERYNPEKLSTVPVLLEKYIGHEDELLESIFTKYNISPEERDEFILNAGQEKAENASSRTYVTEPSPSHTEAPVVHIQPAIKNPEKLILSIYERYNPEKLSTVPVLLEKYSGHEDELLESIFTKYNISPEERDEFVRNAGQEKADDVSLGTQISESAPTTTESPIVQEQTVTETPSISQSYTIESQLVTQTAVETTSPSAIETQTQSSVASHTEVDTQETVINKDEPSPEPVKKKRSFMLVWILISIFVIILLGLGTVAFLQYNGNINIPFLNAYIPTKAKNEVPSTTVEQKKAPATDKKIAEKEKSQQTKKDSTSIAISNNTPVQPIKNNAPVKPVKNNPIKQVNTTSNSGKDFFIIAGSYSSMQQAEEAIRNLKSKGHEGAQVVDQNQNGHIRICYNAYATRQEAMQDLTTIQKNENPTAWIYMKK